MIARRPSSSMNCRLFPPGEGARAEVRHATRVPRWGGKSREDVSSLRPARLQFLDQPHDLSPAWHALFGLVGEDRLTVNHYVQYAHPGGRNLRREIQLLSDFPLEAPGLQQNVDSGEAALDFDIHNSSFGVRLPLRPNLG